jgi:hypothetical protein
LRTIPEGLKRKLVPVIVGACNVDGLLGQIVHIDLVGLDQKEARRQLLAGIRNERAKPASAPAFPGATTPGKSFPGASAPKSAPAHEAYLPKVRRAASDIEKRRFLKSAFDTVRDYFESALHQLGQKVNGLEYDFQVVTALEFTAEIFRQWQKRLGLPDMVR